MVSAGSCSSGDEMTNDNEGADVMKKPPKRDIRRYYCQYCGICRSKKNLIRSHMLVNHKVCDCKLCCDWFQASNLRQHIKAIHEKHRPFTCQFSGCGKKFPYKHVRDKHEKSCVHDHVQVSRFACGTKVLYALLPSMFMISDMFLDSLLQGDFMETDEQLRSRPRGGRKRKCVSVETLQRKRVVPLSQASVLDDGVDYLTWLLNEQ
ncbi:hypothetical protein GW17_00008133 [Ensete ventricosum]|nr:hypothetical protein GW17_00008133 [Ensete ventricosum]